MCVSLCTHVRLSSALPTCQLNFEFAPHQDRLSRRLFITRKRALQPHTSAPEWLALVMNIVSARVRSGFNYVSRTTRSCSVRRQYDGRTSGYASACRVQYSEHKNIYVHNILCYTCAHHIGIQLLHTFNGPGTLWGGALNTTAASTK